MDEDDDEEQFFLDRWADRVMQDPELRAKVLRYFWLTALATMLFGYLLMALILLGHSPFG